MFKKVINFSPPSIGEEEIKEVNKTIRSGWLTMGPKTLEFEGEFAAACNSRNAVAVNSCTSALFLSLLASGVKPGDEVITTPFTFAATANVIEHLGAKPVFIDISMGDFNIDSNLIIKKITKKTKAIIPVHYGGQTADMRVINDIAKKYGLKVIEDAAHAVGSYYENGLPVGDTKNLVCFSFYVTKIITTGEGGMVATNNFSVTNHLRRLRLHGMDKLAWQRYSKLNSWRYDIPELGYKMNMTDLNAALGLAQLKRLNGFIKNRTLIAKRYDEGLSNNKKIILPFKKKRGRLNFHLYPILVPKRDLVIEKLAKIGIMTSVHFIPLYRMSYYKNKYKYNLKDFPVCESVYKRIISLPIYPQLKKEDQDYIINNLLQIID